MTGKRSTRAWTIPRQTSEAQDPGLVSSHSLISHTSASSHQTQNEEMNAMCHANLEHSSYCLAVQSQLQDLGITAGLWPILLRLINLTE